MKELNSFIKESMYADDPDDYDNDYRDDYDDYDDYEYKYEQEYNEYKMECEHEKTTLVFKNQSALMLYLCEFAGQISDGEWENAEPEYHWLWTVNIDKYKFGTKSGYDGVEHLIDYDVSSWYKIWEKPKYDFAYRIFNFAKFGSLLSNSKIYDERIYECLGFCISDLPEKKEYDYSEYVKNLEKNYKDYYNKCKDIFTEENYNKFYESDYNMSDFKKDLDYCYVTLNKKL